MINFNGNIIDSAQNQLFDNRAFLFGDAVFETLKVIDNKVLFLEDHYFRLMSSMRILRMEIPMNFTMEFLESEITTLLSKSEKSAAYRVRITVYRNSGGFYLPQTNDVGYLMHCAPLQKAVYEFSNAPYEVDIFKDFYVTKQLLSSVKSTNRAINITGSIYADENGLQNCLLLNDSKNVIEALNGNLFMLNDNKLRTPPVSEGCIGGVMRKQILAIARKIEGLEVSEEPISPFDLQKADELFITNIILGIQPITKYRKKEFQTQLADELLIKLNAIVRLG
jgi:branched-chain amino acid aminotransferase